MHDAVQMERLGVPATLVMTEPFIPLAAAFSTTLGVAAYPAVVVPHPVASLSEHAMDRLAESVMPMVYERLTVDGQLPSDLDDHA